jgi:hypothetical protein
VDRLHPRNGMRAAHLRFVAFRNLRCAVASRSIPVASTKTRRSERFLLIRAFARQRLINESGLSRGYERGTGCTRAQSANAVFAKVAHMPRVAVSALLGSVGCACRGR